MPRLGQTLRGPGVAVARFSWENKRLKRLGADEYVSRHYDQSKGMSQVFQLLESYKSDPELTQEVENELRPFILEIAKDTPVQRLRAQ